MERSEAAAMAPGAGGFIYRISIYGEVGELVCTGCSGSIGQVYCARCARCGARVRGTRQMVATPRAVCTTNISYHSSP